MVVRDVLVRVVSRVFFRGLIGFMFLVFFVDSVVYFNLFVC